MGSSGINAEYMGTAPHFFMRTRRPVPSTSRSTQMPQSLTEQLSRAQQIEALEKDWATNPRWKGVKRGYSAADVVRLRGSMQIEHTLAKRGAEKLWDKVNGGAKKGYVNAFGAISAGQAMQQAKAGLEAVYLSGWQVAADGNTSETMYPNQSPLEGREARLLRRRRRSPARQHADRAHAGQARRREAVGQGQRRCQAVSYTHLTLPTIYSV
eukprot:TRINITY_DN11718_c0_g1_i6.p1 TRINITY_DN11718_c0_g1~~TRINITY_DN11718_c0_g1_i6.p1  ORF type:complete len:226 (-),score=46.64 TRINITY_DN11718_c0_g1_i6:59-691(-)